MKEGKLELSKKKKGFLLRMLCLLLNVAPGHNPD